MNVDTLTIAIAVGSFVAFMAIHLVACRRLAPESVLSALLKTSIAVLIFPVMGMAALYSSHRFEMPWQIWCCVTFFAMALLLLMCFVYILCVFGPYETSVRMRLLREIGSGPKEGISSQELGRRYNAQVITAIRLRRLTGSAYLSEKDGVYRMGNSTNIFFLFDIIAGSLKFLIGKKG